MIIPLSLLLTLSSSEPTTANVDLGSGWWRNSALRKKMNRSLAPTTRMWIFQDTRSQAWQAIARDMARQHRQPAADRHVYEFGVFTGGGLAAWLRSMQSPSHAVMPEAVWGFDSFKGMPDQTQASWNPGWKAGGLNAAAEMGITRWDVLRRTIIQNIVAEVGDAQLRTRLHLIQGFFNASLAGGRKFAVHHGMKPALLLDIDCDIYSSTVEALEFMLKTGLLDAATYVYYDDMDWDMFHTPPGRENDELKGHREVSKRYGLEWELLEMPKGRAWRPVLKFRRGP